MRKNSILKLLSLALCFVLFAAMALCNVQAETVVTEPVATEESENVAVLGTMFLFRVIDKEGNETLYVVCTDKTTVGEALLAYGVIAGEESTFGLYVKTVFVPNPDGELVGITADYNVDGTYWAFYINGEYAMTGVDSTVIEYGAEYTFKVE